MTNRVVIDLAIPIDLGRGQERTKMLLNTHEHHFPLTRPEGLCAVRDCPNRATTVRVTNRGWPVNYCDQHERNAARSFDHDWKHDPRR